MRSHLLNTRSERTNRVNRVSDHWIPISTNTETDTLISGAMMETLLYSRHFYVTIVLSRIGQANRSAFGETQEDKCDDISLTNRLVRRWWVQKKWRALRLCDISPTKKMGLPNIQSSLRLSAQGRWGVVYVKTRLLFYIPLSRNKHRRQKTQHSPQTLLGQIPLCHRSVI